MGNTSTCYCRFYQLFLTQLELKHSPSNYTPVDINTRPTNTDCILLSNSITTMHVSDKHEQRAGHTCDTNSLLHILFMIIIVIKHFT